MSTPAPPQTLDRTPLNRYWCAGHWSPYLRLPDACGAHANRESQRQFFERKDFRQAVKYKRRKFGVGFNNACELVLIDMHREHNHSACCILGDLVMDRILLAAREQS